MRGATRGEYLHVFYAGNRKIAVLNCHDYTHVTVLRNLNEHKVDLVIVPTFNPAVRLYEEFATSDIHRLFAFIVISNIANYGGSGVFAPFRRKGPKQGAVTLNGALAMSRGPCEHHMRLELPIRELKEAKAVFSSKGSADEKKASPTLEWMPPIVPHEGMLFEQPEYRTAIEKKDSVERRYIANSCLAGRSAENIRIAVAHLRGLPISAYLNSRYHISIYSDYIAYVHRKIDQLADDLRSTNGNLDFLVFPEVFLPLDPATGSKLESFAREFGAIVIGGVEYDEDNSAPGENRCRVLVPTADGNVVEHTYWKMTRSQYDARLPPSKENQKLGPEFEMKLGNQLLVFDLGWVSFSVVICYDYSHFDLLCSLNDSGNEPPDVLFVVAYNPDGELYRHCCLADTHRFYQYIVMSNVAQFGGSGVFGPCKTQGQRQTIMHAGVEVEGISCASINVTKLRQARISPDHSIDTLFMKKPGTYKQRG